MGECGTARNLKLFVARKDAGNRSSGGESRGSHRGVFAAMDGLVGSFVGIACQSNSRSVQLVASKPARVRVSRPFEGCTVVSRKHVSRAGSQSSMLGACDQTS